MDVSSEMIHALLPVFLVSVLGASVTAVGFLEGTAEAIASITKVFSGTLSDRIGKRKRLVVLGYGLAAVTKPLFALAPAVGWIFAARFIDRVGKGIRGAPRDALIADVTPAAVRGAAFGLRQTLDTVGAFAGPLLAVALMAATHGAFRTVFWIAVIPAAVAVALLILFVREPERTQPARPRSRRCAPRGALGAGVLVARARRGLVHARALQRGVPDPEGLGRGPRRGLCADGARRDECRVRPLGLSRGLALGPCESLDRARARAQRC